MPVPAAEDAVRRVWPKPIVAATSVMAVTRHCAVVVLVAAL